MVLNVHIWQFSVWQLARQQRWHMFSIYWLTGITYAPRPFSAGYASRYLQQSHISILHIFPEPFMHIQAFMSDLQLPFSAKHYLWLIPPFPTQVETEIEYLFV